jgi:hypothetical protein
MKGNRPKIFDTVILRHVLTIGKAVNKNERLVIPLSQRNTGVRTAGQVDAKSHHPAYPARPCNSHNA